MIIVIICSTTVCYAQDIQPATPEMPPQEPQTVQPAIAEPIQPPLPVVTPDRSLFRRTPVINGQIEQGEWDSFYRFDYGDLQVATYVNWDGENLYVASKSTSPTDLLVILDANNDGWFHGMDNYEFVARRSEPGGNPTLAVSRYESQKTPGNSGSPLTATEAAAFTLKTGTGEKLYVYELAIPKSSVAGLNLKSGKKIGLKVAVGIGGADMIWVPTAPLGETQTVELVSTKSSSSAPLNVNVQIRDARIAPGEELIAKITVKNTGETAVPVDTLVVGGEGRTSKTLGSQLIRLEEIKPGKSFTTTFRTPVPRTATTGSAALGVELRSGDNPVASSLLSFDIVPAYEVKLGIGDRPLQRGVYSRIAAFVKNNTQKEIHGKIKLSLPDGWTFRWSQDSKDFYIRQEESEQAIVFRVKPPTNPQAKTPVLAEIKIGDQVISTSGIITVK